MGARIAPDAVLAGQLCVTTPWPQFVRHCRTTSPVDVSVNVSANPYIFGVEFNGAAGASKSYSLTTAFAAAVPTAGR